MRKLHCPHWRARAHVRGLSRWLSPQLSAASFHSPLEDPQHLPTQHCYILDGVIFYGVDSYALWVISNTPSWDSLQALIHPVTTKTVFRHLLGHKTNPC